MRAVHYFTDEYLARCRKMTPEEIVAFLDDFRESHAAAGEGPSRLISLKVPEPMLAAFRAKAKLRGARYQTQIKKLMQDWLERG